MNHTIGKTMAVYTATGIGIAAFTAVQASMATMDQTTAEAPYCRGIQPIHHAAAVYISVPGARALAMMAGMDASNDHSHTDYAAFVESLGVPCRTVESNPSTMPPPCTSACRAPVRSAPWPMWRAGRWSRPPQAHRSRCRSCASANPRS